MPENAATKKSLIYKPLRYLIDIVLQHPIAFEIQQKLCNNYSAINKNFSSYLNQTNKHILDIGCSTGTCASQVVDMAKNHYYGIDIDPLYIERAKKNFPAGNFYTMDARHLEFEAEKFDVVTFIGVLHHMPNELIQDCLNSIKQAMKPNGVILVAEPLFTPGKHISNFLLSLDRGKFIRDQHGYKKLFADFKVINENYFRFSAHRFYSLIITL